MTQLHSERREAATATEALAEFVASMSLAGPASIGRVVRPEC
jgi:hypothetical protein